MESRENMACPYCSQIFAGTSLLDLHLDRVHGDAPELHERIATRQFESIVYDWLSKGFSSNVIVKWLVEKGVNPSMAEQLVCNVHSQWRAYRKSEAMEDIWPGVAILAIGGVITIGTYLMAESGGVYVLTWGLLLYGGYRLIKGLSKLS